MNLRDIDLNLLCAFEALVVERHVTRAARRIGIGQPAMSDALRRLRTLFDDPLFMRADGGMQPTPRAKLIAAQTGPLLDSLRAVMDDHVSFRPQVSDQVFTIASTDYTTMVLLPALTAAMRREAPNVDLRIRGYDKDAVGGLLDRSEIDIAIGVFPAPPPNMIRSRLFQERFVGVIRADHPAIRGGAIDAPTFATLPHALVSVRRDERGVIDERLAELGLSRRVALVVPYMMLLPKTLAASDLVAAIPERAARGIAGGELACFELPFRTDPWTVDMLWSQASRKDKAKVWLRSLVQATAKLL